MNATIRAEINRRNAENSTGPTSQVGKQKSALNGIKHGLTGQRMLLQPHEVEPYERMTEAFHHDYKPRTEIECRLVQHIVDCNMRLHRIAAIESNLFSIGAVGNIREDAGHDDVTEAVIAQTRAWLKQEDSFEKLGRYESRISRQMLKYTGEIERIQNLRKQNLVQLTESKPDNTKLALLCNSGQALSSEAPGQGRDAVVRASSCKTLLPDPQPDGPPRTMTAESFVPATEKTIATPSVPDFPDSKAA